MYKVEVRKVNLTKQILKQLLPPSFFIMLNGELLGWVVVDQLTYYLYQYDDMLYKRQRNSSDIWKHFIDTYNSKNEVTGGYEWIERSKYYIDGRLTFTSDGVDSIEVVSDNLSKLNRIQQSKQLIY